MSLRVRVELYLLLELAKRGGRDGGRVSECEGGGRELRVALHKSTSYLTHCYYAAVYSEVISHFKVWFQRSREKRSCISLTLCFNQLFRSRQSFLSGKELITVKQQYFEKRLRNTGFASSPGRVMSEIK